MKKALCILLSVFLALTGFGCAPKGGNKMAITTFPKSYEETHPGELDSVEPYFLEEMAAVRTRVREQIKTDKSGFSYIYLTDSHLDASVDWGTTKHHYYLTKKLMAIAVEMANTTDVDAIILGGDLLHGTTAKSVNMQNLLEIRDILACSEKPVILCRGNHDANNYCLNFGGVPQGADWHEYVPLANLISGEEWAETMLDVLLGDKIVHDTKNAKSSYYYVDFPEKKTRVVVFDAYDFPMTDNGQGFVVAEAERWNHVSDRQMQWLAEEAFAVPDGWNSVLQSHAVLYEGGTTGGGPFKNSKDVCAIVKAVNTHSAVDLPDYNIHADFSGTDSRILFYQFGHTHYDGWIADRENDLFHINCGQSTARFAVDIKQTPNFYNEETRVSSEALGEYSSAKEAVMDIVCYSKKENSIARIRYGSGEDETYDIDEKLGK